MAEMFELVGEANRDEVPGAVEAVAEMLELVGLATIAEPEQAVGAIQVTGSADGEVISPEALLAERQEARANKDFTRADEIRDQLAELGYEVRDSADGPRLVPKS
jgi:cysteinyl-tRNA synthetase